MAEVVFTATGSRAAADLAVARQRKMSGILDRIPETERSEVMRTLRTLIEAIHENTP